MESTPVGLGLDSDLWIMPSTNILLGICQLQVIKKFSHLNTEIISTDAISCVVYWNEMLHKAWSSIEEVPYCFWRSSVKIQGHAALKIVEFDPK